MVRDGDIINKSLLLSIIFMTHRYPVCQIALPVVVHFIDSYAIPGKTSTPKVVHELVIFPQSHGSTLLGEHMMRRPISAGHGTKRFETLRDLKAL